MQYQGQAGGLPFNGICQMMTLLNDIVPVHTCEPRRLSANG